MNVQGVKATQMGGKGLTRQTHPLSTDAVFCNETGKMPSVSTGIQNVRHFFQESRLMTGESKGLTD